MDRLAKQLGINNAQALHGRAEDFGRDATYREKFDLCVSRAVARMNILSEYCLPLVSVGGGFIAYKGPECDEELKEAESAIFKLGGRINEQIKTEEKFFELELTSRHRLILIDKDTSTPNKYPRKPGEASKAPIK